MMNSVRASPRKNKDNLIMNFSFFFSTYTLFLVLALLFF